MASFFYNLLILEMAMAIISNVQFLFKPAVNPDEILITVWELRARLAS